MKPKPNPRPNTISNPDSRVAGNAQGRASEFYKGKTQPVYGTIYKKAPGPKKSAGSARGGYVSGPVTPVKPKKRGGR